MKPPQFAAWLFAQLGAQRGDELVDVFPGSGAIAEAWRRYGGQPPLSLPAASPGPCPDCHGRSHTCEACITAAGDPAPTDFVLGPGVEQVRRCSCGRVYGAHHAGRTLCFLLEPPGRRQVLRCVRCERKLTARSTSDCGAELGAGVDARHVPAAHPRPDGSRSAAARADEPGYDVAAVCREQGRSCPVNGARCESLACIDVGCVARDECEERAA